MKRCGKCHNDKDVSGFYIDKRNPNNRTSYCKDCRRVLARERARKERREVVTRLGGKCACCREDKYEFLSIDHINGGGLKHRTETGTTQLFKLVKKDGFPVDKYRILCHNCNQARGHYGYCPHEQV